MTQPKLLDLFAGAGGCSVGYARAGFDVVGVDIEPHPDYPFRLVVADALAVMETDLPAHFDAFHASPPCQGYTTMSNRHRGQGGKADDWPKLIAPVRAAFKREGKPFVIENVPGARQWMRNPLTLHGGMFGLHVARPRLFEIEGFAALIPTAPAVENPVGVYGNAPDGRRLFTRADGTIQRAARSVMEAADAMGIDWMTEWGDLREAVPPSYTEFLGEQLLAAIEVAA